ncbi:hypothetical protein [Bacillus timonensis]|uniref:hypothetical protein n=1 Tax=Bacillus timonensis TaxID=1033734 RepID=UPI0002881192|nr:hypothetical protein [Bacillus timonensis]
MAFDFDPFDTFDMNHDMSVDAADLQNFEVLNHGTYSIDDLDHDMVIDKFDNDLNNDLLIDEFQADLDHNNVIDQFEQGFGPTQLNYDFNYDNDIDYMDEALVRYNYNL